jgi:hypothetical protein
MPKRKYCSYCRYEALAQMHVDVGDVVDCISGGSDRAGGRSRTWSYGSACAGVTAEAACGHRKRDPCPFHILRFNSCGYDVTCRGTGQGSKNQGARCCSCYMNVEPALKHPRRLLGTVMTCACDNPMMMV